MRGQKVFNEIIKENGLNGIGRKGRNNMLVNRRNECLAARYFYYGYIKRKCFEDILRFLVAEFFLSPSTISAIIVDNTNYLHCLKKKDLTMFYFQNKWPHLKWS